MSSNVEREGSNNRNFYAANAIRNGDKYVVLIMPMKDMQIEMSGQVACD